ncbi:phosphoribosyltransferase [Lachnoclostridium sp. Marseille-P6806]|uniref:phosphoribosyltransferase n=1 Tax=Lachnoclostridium sp. Marseille-P6806 TaxID=2364793 RepID=UPI0010307B84|nr:phosphoribosyltransferase [Lachnoclostridium sp. Marseille-P6806]
MQGYRKINCKRAPEVFMKVIPGHFVTPNSHINYYIDMTTMKARLSEAQNAAKALAQDYVATTIVDSVICMDGCEVIGAFLAEELTRAGVLSMNQHKTIYVVTPEYDLSGQMIFRENMQMMVRDKNVLILLASTTTGTTLGRAIDGIRYYGGRVSGISAIFSAASRIGGMDIHALFGPADLPDYRNYAPDRCDLCRRGEAVDAICNGFGFSRLG